MSDNLQIQPGKWTYREFNDYLRAFNTGDFRTANKLASKIIVKWGFETKLEGDNPVGKLPMVDGAAVLRAIPEKCGELLDTINDADFSVDLSAWTMDDFTVFGEKGREGDLEYVESEMRRIAKVNGKPLEAGTIMYLEGAMIMRKVQKEVQKVLSGKN